MSIGIIDYGSGNFASVFNAFSIISPDIVIINNRETLNKCSHIVLPGVGTFGSAMSKLKEMNLVEPLYENVIEKKSHFLGICVGFQILADFGFEFGEHKGLGYIKGKVVKLEIDHDKFSLPHMGWNSLIDTNNSPLFNEIDEDATFYFVHSFYFETEDADIKTVNTFYGKKFVAAISHENIHGVQFHPEKSQFYGIKLLNNFVNL